LILSSQHGAWYGSVVDLYAHIHFYASHYLGRTLDLCAEFPLIREIVSRDLFDSLLKFYQESVQTTKDIQSSIKVITSSYIDVPMLNARVVIV